MTIFLIILIIASFYTLLWVSHFVVKPEKGWFKTILNILKFTLLIPFWLIILINTVNLFLPVGISEDYGRQYAYIENVKMSPSTLLFLGKINNTEEWFIIHPVKESKLKALYELGNSQSKDSIYIDIPYDSIILVNTDKLDSYGKVNGLAYSLKDTLKTNGSNIRAIAVSNINEEFELTQAAMYLLVIFGIWYHAVSVSEKESRGKFIAGAIVATVLCMYIIYHYLIIFAKLG